MKTRERKTVTGPVVVKKVKGLTKVKTEGAFQEKVDKANNILKTVGLPKGIQL